MMPHDETAHSSEETLFEKAIALPDGSAREEYLRAACGSDLEKLERIEALLRADDRAEELDFLTSGQPREARGGIVSESMLRSRIAASGCPGEMIGPFELLRQIGQGGMGTVWLAVQGEPIKREVALKIINPGIDTEAVSARFETERRALAMMEHPHIARFLDAGVSQSGRPYFAMEYVEGIQITSFCDRKILTVEQRLRLMVQVCRAVQHAHQKGVLHRDLKPSNILVTSQDGQPVPKVIDFGIAKALREDVSHLGRTIGKQFLGTPAYMSPEQAGFSRDIDTRADIFSLGAVLYELLTGTPPIDPEQLRGAKFEQVIRLVHDAEAPPLSKRLLEQGEALHEIAIHRRTEPGPLARALRGDLEWIAGKALSNERGRRYESAEEFAKDIERHLADEPVMAGPPSHVYRARKFVRKYRGIVVAGSSAAAALVIAFATSALMYAHAGVALHDQSLATQRVADERAAKEQAQREAEGLLSFAFEDLKDQLEPRGQLQVLGEFVDPAAAHIRARNAETTQDDGELERLHMLLVFGDIRREQGRLADAARFYSDARSVKPRDLDAATGREWRAAHVQAELNLGRLHQQGGRWDEAYSHFDAALRLLSEAPGSEAQSVAILREMAENRRAAGDLDAALELSVQERERLTSISDRSPSDPATQLLLADAQIFAGRIHFQEDELKEAESLLEAAIQTLSEMIAGPSVDAARRSSYVEACTLLGDIQRRDRSEAALSRYLAAREGLWASVEFGIERESGLAEVSKKIGWLHENADPPRPTDAEIAYSTSLKHFVAAAKLQSSEISFVEGQAKTHLALARIRNDQHRDIRADCLAGVELVRRLQSQDPENSEWQDLEGEFKKLAPSSTEVIRDEGGAK